MHSDLLSAGRHVFRCPLPRPAPANASSPRSFAGVDTLAQCVAAVGNAARAAVAAISPEDRVRMQEAVRSTQSAAAEAAAAPASAAPRTSAQVRVC